MADGSGNNLVQKFGWISPDIESVVIHSEPNDRHIQLVLKHNGDYDPDANSRANAVAGSLTHAINQSRKTGEVYADGYRNSVNIRFANDGGSTVSRWLQSWFRPDGMSEQERDAILNAVKPKYVAPPQPQPAVAAAPVKPVAVVKADPYAAYGGLNVTSFKTEDTAALAATGSRDATKTIEVAVAKVEAPDYPQSRLGDAPSNSAETQALPKTPVAVSPATLKPDIRQTALADLAKFGFNYMKAQTTKYVSGDARQALGEMVAGILKDKAVAPAAVAEAPAPKASAPVSVARNDGKNSEVSDFHPAADVIDHEVELAKREAERVAVASNPRAGVDAAPAVTMHSPDKTAGDTNNTVIAKTEKPHATHVAEAKISKPSHGTRHHQRHYFAHEEGNARAVAVGRIAKATSNTKAHGLTVAQSHHHRIG